MDRLKALVGRYMAAPRTLSRIDALEEQVKALGSRETGEPTSKVSRQELDRTDRRLRARLLDGTRGLAPFMSVAIDGTVYFFDPSDPTGSELFLDRKPRTDHTRLRRAVHALDRAGAATQRRTFLDVGAHIGTTTLFALRSLRFSDAVAIEPSLENMRLLRLGVLANGLEDVVKTVLAAVSDQEGIAELVVGGLGSEYHHLPRAGPSSALRELVKNTTLDTLAAAGVFDPDHVSLAWLDIEGYEMHALAAGTYLLERGVPLVIEVCRDKLIETGKLGDVASLLGQHYTDVLDLSPSSAEAQFVPVAEAEALIESYGRRCTDLLVCRLPPS
jgi:FkbM family methyltransferase